MVPLQNLPTNPNVIVPKKGHVMKLILNMNINCQVFKWECWQTCTFLYINPLIVAVNDLSLFDLSPRLLDFILIRRSTSLREAEQARFNILTLQVIVAINTLRWEWYIIFWWCKVSLFKCVVTKFVFKYNRVKIPYCKFCINFVLSKQRETRVFESPKYNYVFNLCKILC